jgi:hypothetical protein
VMAISEGHGADVVVLGLVSDCAGR